MHFDITYRIAAADLSGALKIVRVASYIQTALYSTAQSDEDPYEYMTAVLQNKNAVIQDPEKWFF